MKAMTEIVLGTLFYVTFLVALFALVFLLNILMGMLGHPIVQW